MKKLVCALSIVALVATGKNLCAKGENPAQDAARNSAKFVKILKNHKAEWLKLEADMHKAKSDLLISEHDAMFNQKIKNIEKYANSTTQEYNKMTLPDMVKMHRDCMNKWHKMCISHENKAKAIYIRHVKEVTDFERSMGMIRTVVETEETYEKTVTQ